MVSISEFQADLINKAKANKQRIVLPEGDCDRVLKAADEALKQEVAGIIILGNPDTIQVKASALGLDLSNATIVDYLNAPEFEDYVNTLAELRKAKGLTLEEAREMMKDGAYYGTMMVYKGVADGMVSGAEHTTANTIRPALQFVKTKPNATMVSGAFLMCYNGQLQVFADCAVTPNPTSEQLSEIAVTTAETARLFGLDPKVAFLS